MRYSSLRTGEYLEKLREPCEKRLGWQQFYAGCRQFNCQWQTIQAPTDFCNSTCVGLSQLERGQYSLSTLDEQSDCCILGEFIIFWKFAEVGKAQRRHGKLMFCTQMQHFAARHQYFQARANGKQFLDKWSRRHDLLEVVQH